MSWLMREILEILLYDTKSPATLKHIFNVVYAVFPKQNLLTLLCFVIINETIYGSC